MGADGRSRYHAILGPASPHILVPQTAVASLKDKVLAVRLRPAVALAFLHVLGRLGARAEHLAAVVLVAVQETVGQV